MPEEASLIITNSGIPNAVPEPGFIAYGELTLNWADSALYFKDANGVIQTISIQGVPAMQLTNILPENEGPWSISPVPGNPPNTSYHLVQKAEGDLPRLKFGLIPDPGPNYVEIVDDTDIIVGVVEGTTMTQLAGLIRGDADANALVRIFTDFPGFSDGTGDITGSLPLLESATFVNSNGKKGNRAEIVGQQLIVKHSGNVTQFISHSEWTAVQINPTVWAPRTAGIIFNNDTQRWEVMRSNNGILESILLLDQPPIV